MELAKKYGASNYATFRRNVITNPHACCVVILEPPPVYTAEGTLSADVRRVVMSKSFEKIFDGKVLTSTVTDAHPLGSVVPVNGKRMSFAREIVLTGRNPDKRICIGGSVLYKEIHSQF
jgi:hypothetical protein